jgi:hypothetical protein
MPIELETEQRWKLAQDKLNAITGKQVDLQGALFLIGVQELGQGIKIFSKEEKQDLMHIATCRVLSPLGYFRLLGHDADGWPIWEANEELPFLKMQEQDKLLKTCIADYLEIL